MLEFLGFIIVSALVLFLIGVALKVTWFVAGLLLIPLKLVFALGGILLAGALCLFLLPATLLAVLALAGGLVVVVMGALASVF